MNLKNLGIVDYNVVNAVYSTIQYYNVIICDEELYKTIFFILTREKAVLSFYNIEYLYHTISKDNFEKLKLFSRKLKLYNLHNKNKKLKNKHRCNAFTNKDEPCKLMNRENSDYCWQHHLLNIRDGTI